MKLVSSSRNNRVRNSISRGRNTVSKSGGVGRNTAQTIDNSANRYNSQYSDNAPDRSNVQYRDNISDRSSVPYRDNTIHRSSASYSDDTLDMSKVPYRENNADRNSAQYINNGSNGSQGQHRDNTINRKTPRNQVNGGSKNNSATKTQPVQKSHGKTIAIIVLVIMLGFSALFVSLGFYVNSLDTIFPNVWADGIKVSGMTVEEATQALIDEGYERNAEGISVTILFPDETGFSVTGDEVGLALNASEAAQSAFMFGRDESFFRNEITYIRALLDRTDLSDLSTPVFDDSIVRELVSESTNQFNGTLLDSFSDITDDGITILKGSGLHPANESTVFDLAISTLIMAVEENNHLTVNYVPEKNTDDTIDLQYLFSERIHIDPVSSWYDPELKGATESLKGRSFDLEKAIEDFNNAEYGSTIFIPIEVLEPLHTKEFITSRLFNEVLAESKTTMSPNTNRIRNIEVAAGFINETVLEPGDVFSFNEVVGRRTSDRGFLPAGGFQDGVLQDVIGGGICQMSSTLYDAILHTDLEVRARRPHTFRVTYLPPGNDATVVFDNNTDFRFENTTDFPIRIYASTSGRELSVKLLGTKWDNDAPGFVGTTHIEIETVVISEVSVQTEERESEDHFIGERIPLPGSSGIPGITADTFKLIYASKGGELLERVLVGRSQYRMQPNVILIGTRPHDEHIDPGAQG